MVMSSEDQLTAVHAPGRLLADRPVPNGRRNRSPVATCGTARRVARIGAPVPFPRQ